MPLAAVSTSLAVFSFGVMLALVAVHLFAGKLRLMDRVPRSRWLSAAGGVSVAYVFVHLLPQLAKHEVALSEAAGGGALAFLEHHVYLVAMVGLAAFYGLERLVQTNPRHDETAAQPSGVFWVHVGGFGIYNVLIGYVLVRREEDSLLSLGLFGLAMLTHFLTNDVGLSHHHRHLYRRFGRWLMAAAVAMGWLVGVLFDVADPWLAVLFGLLAGGVVLNVLKEELLAERESRFWAFALGAMVYAALLITIPAVSGLDPPAEMQAPPAANAVR